jgi:hypothetical protein
MALRQSIRAQPDECHASKQGDLANEERIGRHRYLLEKTDLEPLLHSMRKLARMRCESAHRMHPLAGPASGSCGDNHSHELGHERHDLKIGVGPSQSCGEFRKGNVFACARAIRIVGENAMIAIVDDAVR